MYTVLERAKFNSKHSSVCVGNVTRHEHEEEELKRRGGN